MTKSAKLLIIGLVLGLLLAACDSSTTPEAAPAEAEAPAEVEAEQEAEQAEEAAEAEAVAEEDEATAAPTEAMATEEAAAGEVVENEEADPTADSSLVPEANTISEAAASASMPELQYGLVVTQLNDKGFNDLAWAGMQRAADEFDVDVQYLQDSNPGTAPARISQLIGQGVDGVVTVGFEMAQATETAAEANQDVPIAIVDFPNQTPYDRGLLFDVDAPAFMAGYLAAGMSQSGTVCTYGGQQTPPVLIFMVGFEHGVDYYNEQNDAEVELLGWSTDPSAPAGGAGIFAGSFSDQAFGRTIAAELAAQGCDIIFPVAGAVGLGTAEVAAENDLTVIGVDADQSVSNPEFADLYLTSVVKRVDLAVFETLAQMIEGAFAQGSNYIGTLENGGVDLAPFHSFEDAVSDMMTADLETIRQGLIDGEISTGWPIGASKIQTSLTAGNLTLVALRNATYDVEYTADGTAPLTNGEYREAAAPGSASEIVVRLGDQIAYGDFTGDGQDEAVTFLVSDTGGSGTFYDLVLVDDVDETPTQVASTFLGDRVEIKGLEINEGLIGILMVTQGPNDPQSAPTQEVVKVFNLQDGELVELASQVVEGVDGSSN